MSIRRSTKPLVEFSVASMADLVFLLLIFFMITSSFVNQSGVKVDYPESSSNTPSPGGTTVTVTAEGQYFWNSTPTDLPALQLLLEEVLTDADPNNNVVTLQVDKKTTHEQSTPVIASVAKHGGSVVIATKFNPKAP